MRCGSLDLALPGIRDGVFPEGGELMASVCRRCGFQGAPLLFSDRDGYEQFRVEREALYRPGPRAPTLPPELEPPEPERPRKPWTAGLAALVGFAFITSAAFSFITAAQVGGDAWLVLGPSGVVALLLGVPFVALARRW